MKVTTEMLERAVTAHEKTYGPYAASETGREVLRLLLEAALAVVPEPVTSVWLLDKAESALSRASAAEAKLAKVRAYVARYPIDVELLAILDEP